MVSKISKLAGWQSVISGLKTDSKSVVRATVPRVRIPDSPPINKNAQPSWAFLFIRRALGENPRSTEPACRRGTPEHRDGGPSKRGEARSAE